MEPVAAVTADEIEPQTEPGIAEMSESMLTEIRALEAGDGDWRLSDFIPAARGIEVPAPWVAEEFPELAQAALPSLLQYFRDAMPRLEAGATLSQRFKVALTAEAIIYGSMVPSIRRFDKAHRIFEPYAILSTRDPNFLSELALTHITARDLFLGEMIRRYLRDEPWIPYDLRHVPMENWSWTARLSQMVLALGLPWLFVSLLFQGDLAIGFSLVIGSVLALMACLYACCTIFAGRFLTRIFAREAAQMKIRCHGRAERLSSRSMRKLAAQLRAQVMHLWPIYLCFGIYWAHFIGLLFIPYSRYVMPIEVLAPLLIIRPNFVRLGHGWSRYLVRRHYQSFVNLYAEYRGACLDLVEKNKPIPRL